MKFNVNDLVYIYFGDLRSSLPYRNLNISRFGIIVKIEEVSKDMFEYIIKRSDDSLVTIKSYDASFDICNIEELMDIVYTSNLNTKAKDLNIEIINNFLKKHDQN